MKNFKKIVTLLVIMLMLFTSCQKKAEGLWGNAKYNENTALGNGSKTLTVIVEAEEKKVVFTIKTDKETVGEALLEHSLIEGEIQQYGMYIKAVNGIKADYDTDKAYWSFNKNGEYMMTGVDSTIFSDGEQYELVYTKG